MSKAFAWFAVLLSAATPSAWAAPDFETAASASKTGLEAILFEAPGCRYCEVFRRDVLPTYDGTPTGQQVPLRFIDLNAPAAQNLRLARPVSILPTVVLMRDGVEVGRIDGYVGRQSFHRLLDAMLGGH